MIMQYVRTEKEMIEKLNLWASKRNMEFVRDDFYGGNSFSIHENEMTLTHDEFQRTAYLNYFMLKELYETFSPKNIEIEVNGTDYLNVNIIFDSDIILECTDEKDSISEVKKAFDKWIFKELNNAIKLEKSNKRKALDILFNLMDSFIQTDDFTALEQFLLNIDLTKLGIQLMVGILCFSKNFEKELPNRYMLVQRIRSRIETLDPLRAERLLNGVD